MLLPDALQMTRQCRAYDCGQQGNSILIAFCTSDHDLIGSEIHIFNTELKTFEQSQAGSIQQRRHQPICST